MVFGTCEHVTSAGWIHYFAHGKMRDRGQLCQAIIRQHVTRLVFFSRFVQCHLSSLVILPPCWPPLLALYIGLRWAQDQKNNHISIIQQVSKASLGKLPRSRCEGLCFGWLKKHELVLMFSTKPKSTAAGVQTLRKIIVDSHYVVVSANHKTSPCNSGIIFTCNYINFLVKCWIVEVLFTHKECKLWFCLWIRVS